MNHAADTGRRAAPLATPCHQRGAEADGWLADINVA